MMFIILTHDNQTTSLSFSLYLSFVTNSTVAEKALSGSIDGGLLVCKTLYSFFKVIRHLLICDRISSCPGIILWSSLMDNMDSVL